MRRFVRSSCAHSVSWVLSQQIPLIRFRYLSKLLGLATYTSGKRIRLLKCIVLLFWGTFHASITLAFPIPQNLIGITLILTQSNGYITRYDFAADKYGKLTDSLGTSSGIIYAYYRSGPEVQNVNDAIISYSYGYGYRYDAKMRLSYDNTAYGKYIRVDESPYGLITTTGRFNLYSSKADNLASQDTNGVVADVYPQLPESGVTEPISQEMLGEERNGVSQNAVQESHGEQIVYDRADAAGHRQVYSYNYGDKLTERLSLTDNAWGEALDNHHPGISVDGRYVAYLEEALGPNDEAIDCNVLVLDRSNGDLGRVECPTDLLQQEVKTPLFSADGRRIQWLTWQSSDQGALVPTTRTISEVANPLITLSR
jgi:hypothetical protein